MLSRRVALYALGCILLCCFCAFLGWKLSNDEIESFEKMLGDSTNIVNCMNDIRKNADNATGIDTGVRRLQFELCYSIAVGQGQVNDYRLRRLKFIQQAYDERILLWMVVLITLSGVSLAGLQLWASYILVSAAKITTFDVSGEVSFDKTSMSVKSSGIGLLILSISFAFFLVFVLFVYKINDVKVDDLDKKSGTKDQISKSVPTSGYN